MHDAGHLAVRAGAAAGAFPAFKFMTLPMAFITPLIAARLKRCFSLAAVLILVYPVGYIGLILTPGNALFSATGSWTVAMVVFAAIAIVMLARRCRR